ncbi:hypothetical protein [Edaphobacter aggregans]|uniref:hypothetical protein n=1 Tax=Edaphobacter aggregans TaxID=570835 RepID=UPI000553DD12|nr:hypothetical protein [Edaphobacter aggregans]
MTTEYKFGNPEPEDREWVYGNLWAAEETTGGGRRLVIAPSRGQTDILAALLKDMTGPFWVLYVLVVPRGRGEPGRYQSPEPQAESNVRTFLNDFSGFLEKDGRHNVWIASESGAEMLIYDRHNAIYAYGPLNAWRPALSANGFSEVPDIRFPSPHSHHYHQSLDPEEDRLFNYWDWHHTPLKEADEE